MSKFAIVYINSTRAFVVLIDIFSVLACFLYTLKHLYFLNHLSAYITLLYMYFRYKCKNCGVVWLQKCANVVASAVVNCKIVDHSSVVLLSRKYKLLGKQ